MKRIINPISATVLLAVLSSFGFAGFSTALSARVATATSAASGSNAASPAAVIAKGDQEISQRISALSGLTAKLGSMTKLTASDKASLQAEISRSSTNLAQLKTTLDADTTLASARTDEASIFSGFRVYALVIPQVKIVKVADDQQVKEANLTTFKTLLASKVAASSQSASLLSKLSDMAAKIQAAQSLSAAAKSSTLPLQPSDYNANHQLLTTTLANLKTAQADNQAAYQDGLSVMTALKTSK